LQLLITLTAFIVIMANGIAIALAYLTGLSGEQLHLTLRVASIAMVMIIVFREGIPFLRLQSIFPLILFYLLYVISSARHQFFSGFGDIEPQRFWFVVGPAVVSAIMLAAVLNRARIAVMAHQLNILFLAISAPSLFSIAASQVSNIRIYTVREEDMGSSIAWGQLGAFAIAVALGSMLERKPSPRATAIAVSSALVGAGLIYLSVSRGAFLAAAIVIVAMIFARSPQLDGKARKLLGWFKVFIGTITLIGGYYFLGSENADRLLRTFERIDDGREARSVIWSKTIELGADNLLGYGVASPFASHPHNLFLEAWMNAGVPGILLAAAAFGRALFIVVSNIRHGGANWVDLLFLAVFQLSLVSSSLYLNVVIWFLAALVLSLNGHRANSRTPVFKPAYRHQPTISV